MAEVKLNCVLIGNARCGKSTTGNAILNKKVFNVSSSSGSATITVEYSSRQFGRYLLQVVDTPRILDREMDIYLSETKSITNMETALEICRDGVDAFLLVLKCPCHFTAEDSFMLKTLKKIFGDRFFSHVIVVVLTYGELFEATMIDEGCSDNFEEWCGMQVGEFRQLYDDCEGRCVLFNNIGKNLGKTLEETETLVHLAHSLQEDRGRYTVSDFKTVQTCPGNIEHQNLSTLDNHNSLAKTQMQMDDKEVKLNFLLIGKTGHGKSATGNMILNRRVFKTSVNTTSQTKEVDNSFAQLGRYILLVVDGPGLEDTDLTKDQNKEVACKNMDIALGMCYGGVDAFLFVLKFGERFTKEERYVLTDLKRIFGEKFMSHVIIIVTAGDLFTNSVGEDGSTASFEDWCVEQTGDFQQLYKDCDGRIVLCDNRMSKATNLKTRHEQRERIVKLALDLQKRNGRYTSESFQKADIERKKMISEQHLPQLTREIQEKTSLLAADIDALSDETSEADKKKITDRIQNLKKEIELQDGGSGVLKDNMEIVKKIEAKQDDLVEIRKLAKELESNRSKKKLWNRIGTVFTVVGFSLALLVPPIGAGIVMLAQSAIDDANKRYAIREKVLQERIKVKSVNQKK